MGRKTNPKVFRIGTMLRSWDAKWFADNRSDYQKNLLEDLQIRRYLNSALRNASISRVEIARQPRETVLTIHSSRPAVVIGRGGSGIEKIQKDLKRLIGPKFRVRINVQEVRNPDTDATSVATQIVDQLERRMPFRRVLKQSVQRSMQAGARGVRVSLSGRLNGAEIARTEWLTEGNVPLHTMRADISYSYRIAYTTYGTIGVKVWVNRGDMKMDQEAEEVGEAVRTPKKTSKPRRRTSLADKAAKSKMPAPARSQKKSSKNTDK